MEQQFLSLNCFAMIIKYNKMVIVLQIGKDKEWEILQISPKFS